MTIEHRSRRFWPERLERMARDAAPLCSLATVSPGGEAHINHMYFAWTRRFEVFWVSDPDSRHSRNLVANPSAAVTIYDSHQVWGRPDRGIQLFGTADVVSGSFVAAAERAYSDRFPSYDASQLEAYPFYRFRARTVKLFYERILGPGALVTARVTADGPLAAHRGLCLSLDPKSLCENPQMARRPNLVLIMLDQLRADCLGTYGSAICRSPRLDRIASQGMRFDRAYTPSSICSPARASLFTGKYAHRHGLLNNIHGPDAIATELRPGEITFPALLRGAGYRTAYIGKWHVGVTNGPEAAGFTDVGATDMYLEQDLAAYRRGLGLDAEGPVFSVDLSTSYPPLSSRADRPYLAFFPVMGRERYPLEATPQGYFLDSALALLREIARDHRPFFCVLSFIGPHWPHVLPEPFWSMYDPRAIRSWANFEEDFQDKPPAQPASLRHYGVDGWTWQQWAPAVASYFGSVTMHDEMVGRFIDALDGLGHADDTLLFVTADHGDSTGSHRLFNKGPWMYEEVYRLPLLARWPGVAAPGSHRSEYVSSMDLMATMLEAAGVAAPEGAGPDSASLVPLLRGEEAPEWRPALFAEFHGDEFGLFSQRMVHANRYKFVFNPHSLDELYDLHADPHELVNLAADPRYADLKDDLESRLQAWMRRTADPLWYLSYNYLA